MAIYSDELENRIDKLQLKLNIAMECLKLISIASPNCTINGQSCEARLAKQTLKKLKQIDKKGSVK